MSLTKQKELDEDMSTPEVDGEVLRIDSLPSCARICFNIILLPEAGSCKYIKADKEVTGYYEEPKNNEESKFEDSKFYIQKFLKRQGFVLGSCSLSIFDERFLIRQGRRECRMWPFESFHPRRVCQGECYEMDSDEEKNLFSNLKEYKPNRIAGCMTMLLEF